MNQKKREELEREISYFREQLQPEQFSPPLPPSLEGRRLAQLLTAQEEQRERIHRPLPRRWAAMACSLALVACLSAWYLYQEGALPKQSLMEDAAGAVPQAAAFALEESAPANGEEDLLPEGLSAGEEGALASTPQMAMEDAMEDAPVDGLMGRAADAAQEASLSPAESLQQLTGQLERTAGDGESAAPRTHPQKSQVLVGLLPGEGTGTEAGRLTFEAGGTLLLEDSQGQLLSRTALPQGTSQLVVWEGMAAALVPGEEGVELTLYDLTDYSAPLQGLSLVQQGELADCAVQEDRLLLLTWAPPQEDRLPWIQLEGEAQELEPGQVYLPDQLISSQPTYLVATLVEGEKISSKAVLGEVVSAFGDPSAAQVLLTLSDAQGQEYSSRLSWE